jgi:hypothetical protein
MITYLEIIIEKGKLYGEKYKAYYGEVPFCLKVINNSYGEPWGIDFSCPDDKLLKEKKVLIMNFTRQPTFTIINTL